MATQWEMNLYDYKDEFQWIRMLGWSDEDLQKVPVHEQATAGEDYINLANFGGTALGVTARGGGGTSANVKAIRNMYVYKREVPVDLWDQLHNLQEKGGPSGYEIGLFGERGDASDFPPQR
ncbi:MAG: hypothetical protein HYX94_10420 [Chloroflexi bacterium]|nr:hypothetical protein [Chloroflexota bacterium]